MKKKTLKNTKIKKRSKTSSPFRFPNIIRIFTDKHFLVTAVSLVLIVAVFIVSLDLYKDIKDQQKIEKERKDVISKIQYWEGIVNKYKDYRDAYFQLALLEYRLKNFDKAKSYLNKALSLDPNFEKGRELEAILAK